MQKNERLMDQVVEQDDVRVSLTDRGKNVLIVAGPGNAPSDERASVAKIGDRMHFPVRCGEQPEVGAKPVIERKSEPFAV